METLASSFGRWTWPLSLDCRSSSKQSPILNLQDVRGKTTTLAAHLNGMTCWKARYQLSNSYAKLRGIATMDSSSGHLNQISQYIWSNFCAHIFQYDQYTTHQLILLDGQL
jgi:hypothetical protein